MLPFKMSPSAKKIVFCLLVLVAVDAGLCKSLSGNREEGLVVKLLDSSDAIVEYEVEKEERRKPKNCVGVVTLMALCF